MIAGRLTTRLRVYRPVTDTDVYGNDTLTWVVSRDVRAERVNETARRVNEVGEHFPAHSAKFNVRRAHAIGENWRVEEVGGDLYTVTAVVKNRRRGFNTLICERVNE